MNKYLLMAGLFTVSTSAFAWGEPTPPPADTSTATATATSDADATGGNAIGGNTTVIGGSTKFQGRLQIPGSPSAIAPTVVGTDCDIFEKDPAAWSVFFSRSYMKESRFRAFCYAFKRGQYEISDAIACEIDANYARLAGETICGKAVKK